MIDLKNLVFSLIITSIVISICEFLAPDDSYKKRMKILTGTVFLICLLTPIKSDISIDYNDFKNVSNKTDYEYVVARSVCEEVFVVLEDYDIDDASVDVHTKIDANGSVIVECISIDLSKDNLVKKQKIINDIKKVIKTKVKINGV